jgi:selenocysteine lyase/cysteine desulfurase
MLASSRAKVAKILNCQTENVVLVSNATLGTNSVLRDMVFKDNDAMLYFSLTYGAVDNNIDYLIDTEKMRGIRLHKVRVELNPPWTIESMLQALRNSIQEAKDKGKRIVIGVVDTISSKPAVRMPWEDMVKILKEHQILSLVDGAHGIGHIPIDLTAVDPDFFVSNCHKWLYAHRGCAVLYVAPRNLHLQRSSLPTGWSYQSSPTKDNNTWA